MSTRKSGGGLSAIFLRPESETKEPSTPTSDRSIRRPPPEEATDEPERISSLVPGGAPQSRRASVSTSSPKPVPSDASAPTGPSEKVMALVDEVRKHVPTDNPTMKLMEAMKPLEAFLPEPTARKAAALGVLASQGVTAEAVKAGAREVEEAIDTCLNGLLAQADGVRKRDVDAKLSEAERLRNEAADLSRKIDDLNRQAGTLDAQARTSESQLNQFKIDIEAARAHAREVYGV